MMRLSTLALIAIALCLALIAPVAADDSARRFMAGVDAYKAGNFQQAVDQFQALAESGVVNGKLYYNLGNAYLKQDDLGLAILWYERALTLLPNDPDLHFNYAYARSLTKDAQDEGPSPLVRIFFFWKYQLSPATIKILALGLNLLLWIFVMIRIITRRPGFRRAAWITLVPALIFILTAGYNYYEAANRQQAIVIPQQVAVRSGLETTSTELFKLHAGAKVNVVKTLKDHCQIRFSEDKTGWVRLADVGLI